MVLGESENVWENRSCVREGDKAALGRGYMGKQRVTYGEGGNVKGLKILSKINKSNYYSDLFPNFFSPSLAII